MHSSSCWGIFVGIIGARVGSGCVGHIGSGCGGHIGSAWTAWIGQGLISGQIIKGGHCAGITGGQVVKEGQGGQVVKAGQGGQVVKEGQGGQISVFAVVVSGAVF